MIRTVSNTLTSRHLGRAALISVSVLSLAACGKKAPPELPPEPVAQTPTSQGPVGQLPVQTGPVPGSQADFIASVRSDRVLFDTDRFNIDSDDQVTLQSQAQWLSRYPGKQIVIEGHADERGTRDYNLALGERRANAAKNYLVTLGVAPSRIRVISYGKERPEALGSTEAAWAQNRRAVTVTVQ
ncbi:peptidoglycan-associated lipoprotein Pal [Alterisphingorhabdus coralli]|uniref:Peptidoglycan-associated lipoprotein n=1 Tax=Alterisphingorhabdus coralli TaxID=3071408 RepID=A0AA97I168_9SPHN|nr:peptidoglycan-associated lipoprotein Pal [Parasphingorhabdus sp. SCSIO 66989]WOE75752.1 peptidoglycan-associated lipoprotein Pal [Parasphingorhabdus sp. SCSIO 66989]